MEKVKHTNIEEYAQAVEQLADIRSSTIFDNKGADHAAAVMASIFNHSGNVVRIYAGSMNGEISSKPVYKDALEKFLQGGKTLRIFLDSVDQLSDTIKRAYQTYFGKNRQIEIKQAPGAFAAHIKTISSDNKLYHFALGDNSMFRIELDGNTHAAVCCFNKQDTTEVLIEAFDNYYGPEAVTPPNELPGI